jgi:hypothetical protein
VGLEPLRQTVAIVHPPTFTGPAPSWQRRPDQAAPVTFCRHDPSERRSLGTLAILHGRLDDAWALLEEGLALGLEARSTRYVSLCLAGMARLALATGEPRRAALVAGAAEGLSRRAGIRAWPTQLREEAELAAELRRTLGAEGFDRAFTTGYQLTQGEAVAAAREGRATDGPAS